MTTVSSNLTFTTPLSNDTLREQPLPTEVVVLLSFVWSLIIVIGAIGNGLVIYIMLRYGERSVTNVYIVNLAFADLMFILFVVPATLIHIVIPTWILGNIICKFSNYMIYVTLHATCLTLSAMTVDRYHAIVNPIDSMNWRSTKTASAISLAVWAVSLSICCPYLIYTKVTEVGKFDDIDCIPQWPSLEFDKAVTLVVVLTTFVLPLTAIIICYACILFHLWSGANRKNNRLERENSALSVKNDKAERQVRRKRRVTRMVAIVVFLFAICWLPIHILAICIKFDPKFPKTDSMHYFKLFAHTLSYANSCVNPFVYAFINEGFRKAIIRRSPKLYQLCSCLLRSPIAQETDTSMVDKAVEAKPGMDVHSECSTATQTTACIFH
ncbi:galanin receptor type 2-like [Mytilus edulis]|uniref:galanin receptor type 2-like n=1 Tax=Mytilus edulis TaxID=6550 RepID=UPI0039F08491